jgi:myo-inositol-1(or 4)-monophosphatase
LRSTLETACEAARLGGKILVEYLGKATVREKGPADLVTDADLASQQAIEQLIRIRFPQHEFLGEESTPADREQAQASGRPVWVVDPLDGTANFVHRLPGFSVSVALVEGSEPKVGVVYDPLSDTLYAATSEGVATKNNKPIRASGCERLDKAMVCCSFRPGVSRHDPEVDQFLCVLESSQSLRRLGSAAMNLCFVAEGCLDAYWATSVKAWDVAAGSLIARAAGAQLTSIQGGRFDLWDPKLLATASGPLHSAMLNCLHPKRPSPNA